MTMKIDQFNQELLAFLDASPTPFHATEQMASRLQSAGFEPLDESDQWQLVPGGKYCVVRNGSSLIAFSTGRSSVLENGFRMIGAHTDSPCLRVKPSPETFKNGYLQLGVEVYGGALLNPWFDRDLSLAGRVNYVGSDGVVKSGLINFCDAIATIPSLAIHLDREANKNRSINPQTDIPPILMRIDDTEFDFRSILLQQLKREYDVIDAEKVLDYELSFYDTQGASMIGLKQEFIASARLDNLLSCFVGMQTLLTPSDQACLLVCTDHEEVGSQSAAGAQGPFLQSVLDRIVPEREALTRAIDRSMMVSADNAHGIHPNYADRHDANHGPLLNRGPVIKTNANQRYASNSNTSSLFRNWSAAASQDVQAFTVRTDMACGSTIGPIAASGIGVDTLDIGVPTFAMHSIREVAGSQDSFSLYKILQEYIRAEQLVVLHG